MKKALFIALAASSLVIATVLLAGRSSFTKTTGGVAGIKIDNFVFGPKSITVPVGTTVTWTNGDDIPHTSVSTDGVFKSKVLYTDEKFSYTFTKSGKYPYYCTIHPKMTGTVIVR